MERIVAGIRFSEILDIIPTPILGEDEGLGGDDWRTWRMRRHEEGGSSIQQQHMGHWRLSTDRRTRQGGYVTVHVDITEMKRREAELSQARDDAESANRAKSEFLALMSHELRTPLNAILGFSEILRDESTRKLDAKRYLEYVNSIHGSGSHLLRLITEILDLSKIEAGKYELCEEDFELDIPFNDVRRMTAQMALDADITLILQGEGRLPGLRGDLRVVRQMLINLISNAIKHTPGGGIIEVTATCLDPADGGGLRIQFSDNGVGIAGDDIPKVLTPFGQIEGPMNRRHQGTGLGLPLVKSFMELHGGALTIDSALGVGTTVGLQFPQHRVIDRSAVQAS